MHHGQRKSLYLHSQHTYKPSYSNPFFKNQRPKKSKRFYYSLALLLISLAGWFYFLLFSDIFKITDWEINGLKAYSKNEVNSSLQSFLQDSHLLIFKNSNALSFNKNNFKEYLNAHYAFQDINVIKYYPHKIIINLKEKENKEIIYNNNKIYVVADDGTIILKKEGIDNWFTITETNTDEFSATSTVESYSLDINKVLKDAQDKSLASYPIFCDAYYSKDPGIGQIYPAADTLKIINEFIDNLHERTNIKIKLVSLIKNQLNPKIIVYTENNWKIYLNNTDAGQKQFYKLYITFQEQIKDLNKPLEYIDLRFGDRVYLK